MYVDPTRRRQSSKALLIAAAVVVLCAALALAGWMMLGATVTASTGTLPYGWAPVNLKALGVVAVGATLAVFLVVASKRR